VRGFRRDGQVFVARLQATERTVLLDVVDGVVSLFGAVADPSDDRDPLVGLELGPEAVEPPEDPALRRLLPDASSDAEAAAELRRLTEGELRVTKVGKLRRLRTAVEQAEPDLVVVPSEAMEVAAALTDVRLVLASRLGLETDAQAEDVYHLATGSAQPADDAEATRQFLAAVYTVLTDLQESLVGLMLADLPRGRHRR
jgi:hypothetical protein